MQDDDSSLIIVAVFVVSFLIGGGIGSILNLNRSMGLSGASHEQITVDNDVYRLSNGGYITSHSTLHHKPQVLASNKNTRWKDVIACESTWRHYDANGRILVGDKHLPIQAYGIAQFQIRTFNWLKDLAGRPELSWKIKDDQIWLLRWAIDNGYGSLWSCY